MAHGQPDYGMYSLAKTIYRLTDMGELAARLGSIVTFDRRGDVIWFDDFEDNIEKWYQQKVGTGAAVALSAEAARSGGKSVKLTTGNVTGDNAAIFRYLPYQVLSKFGVEFSFTVNNSLSAVQLAIYVFDGTNRYTALVRYRPVQDDMQYYDSAGNWQSILTSLILDAYTYMFHTVKLVIDPENSKYVRLIVDDQTVDMSAYALKVDANATAPRLSAEIYAITGIDANVSNYVDDAIITQNEP